MFTWPKNPGYVVIAVVLWSLFLADLYVLCWGRQAGWSRETLWGLAAAPGLIVAQQFYLAYRLIARQDEFARGLTAKRIIAAGGLTIALATGWSVAEQFAGAPVIPMWLMYPLFWSLFAVVTPIIQDSQP